MGGVGSRWGGYTEGTVVRPMIILVDTFVAYRRNPLGFLGSYF
jgi:hypothetical protein